MASVLLALEAEQSKKAEKDREQLEQHDDDDHQHHYLEWQDVGSSRPETGEEVHNEHLRDALFDVVQRGDCTVWFPEDVMHSMQVHACTLHSYIEVNVGPTTRYFRPTERGEARRNEAGHVVHFHRHHHHHLFTHRNKSI